MPLPQSMIRSAPRAALRSFAHTGKPLRTSGSRFVSTQPPHLRSRSWKSSALRWGIAIAGVYYYNTSPVFAEQPHHNLLNPNVEAPDESEATSALHDLINNRSKAAQEINQTSSSEALVGAEGDVVAPGDAIDGVGELEEEAQGQGAFNPETGEINWDCPCLGGMADGPCGPQFKEAFSCFVFSTEEPKGMDCIEKFQGMRDCFAEHPEHYKDELMEDEEIDRELEAEKQELVNQIAERRKADEAAASGYRLLEEPVAPPKPSTPKAGAAGSSRPPKASEPATQGPESQRDTGNVAKAPHQTSQQQPVPEAKIITGSGPQANPEQENIVEGQHSEALRKPAPPPVSAEASPESELVPKAAHDARNSVGPGGNKPEN